MMIYSKEVDNMCVVKKGAYHGPAPIPEEGKWIQAKEIKDISGYTHGVGWCAPQQGACKLSLNIKEGGIVECLIETIGCTGLEDLGKGLRSQTGTLYGTMAKGTRYLELTEGYITKMFLDKDDYVCGYEYVHLGKMMEAIKNGMDANEAVKKFTGRYGRTTADQGIEIGRAHV